MKKVLLFVVACIASTVFLFADTVKFTSAEICSGATKNGVTVSSSYTSTESQQICKEGGKAVKEAIVKVGNTAGAVDQNYVGVSASTNITGLKIHGCINSSGAKNIAMLMWSSGTPAATTDGEQLINLVGYAGECSANVTDVNVPSNIKSFRLYRQMKKYDTSTHTIGSGSSNYGDGSTFYVVDLEVEVESAGPSSNASLSALTFDGKNIPGFAATSYSYNVELAADYTGAPTVAATPADSKAKVDITQPDAVPGTATINVTAEDGTTKKEYKITFTKASSAPKVESATWTNITAAGATVDNVNMTITGKIKYGTGLTAISPSFTGKNIASWTPNTATDFSGGAVKYTLTSSTGETTDYMVTITEADPISDDATLKSLTVAGCTLKPTFSPTTTSYQVEVSGADVPKTTAVANHAAAKAVVTDATSVAGVTKVVVTAEDGVTTKEYTISFKTVVPPSGLTVHVPDIYDQPKEDGGYNTPLVVFNNREYEVYYAGRDNEDNMSISTKNEDRIPGVCAAGNTETSCKAKDGWFEMTTSSVSSCSAAAVDEFAGASGREHRMIAGSGSYKMHIKGFDQFSLYGKDKKYDPAKPTAWNIFEVYIDGIKQEMTPDANNYTVRRFDISSDEHLIEVKAIGGSTCAVVGFSFRVGTDPRVRYVMGNDSSQNILQTKKMSSITYIVKNNIKTEVVWTSGTPATGVNLVAHGHEGVSDTLRLEGFANCPVGTYTYRIVTYDASGNEKSSVDRGSFTVSAQINSVTDTIVNAYEGWSMDAIEFTYYALSADQIHVTWTSATPGGITCGGTPEGTFAISGTPTTQGVYPFIITVDGGNTLTGKLTVEHLDLGKDPVLYMYKGSVEKDGIFAYLKSKHSIMAATQSSVTNMSADQLNKFKVIVIGESTDATNEGAKNLIRHSSIPVLNMQAFAYNPSRLNWGYASNGSAVTAKMKIVQPTHPIFKALNYMAGQEIDLLDSVETKGLVATEIFHEGSWCLSTTAMRAEDYVSDGEHQTFLHEVSAAEHGSKYLCLPIATASSNHLTSQGKNLIEECIKYLMDTRMPIPLPTLQITKFVVDGVSGVIDEVNKVITVTLTEDKDYSAIQPSVTLADNTTFVTPTSGEAVDFSDPFVAKQYVVCDYINKVTYDVYVKHPTGFEDIYMPGEWVNIYDMSGNSVMTTNENVHYLPLPRGIYLIQTATHTFRIFR
ncbi:MAG: cadherin-like beta sandwich domain-containing protein [Paludibacteraceae bacterium]|nr:cadherin-like beta sandwich domain-containing protein [Paludibacteraceae bacterium]